jgi:hypothetical protein
MDAPNQGIRQQQTFFPQPLPFHQSSLHSLSSTSDPITTMMIRQSLQKLPVFTGNPREWTRFKKMFVETTIVGAFDDLANLTRLEEAIQGKARETVESLMYDPANVDEIIKRLGANHGDTTVIINELFNDLRKVKAPKDGPSSLIIQFSNKLNNLVANVKALGKMNYLRNPVEVNNLVAKLPHGLKAKWTEKWMKANVDPTLEDLSIWIHNQAQIEARMSTGIALKNCDYVFFVFGKDNMCQNIVKRAKHVESRDVGLNIIRYCINQTKIR